MAQSSFDSYAWNDEQGLRRSVKLLAEGAFEVGVFDQGQLGRQRPADVIQLAVYCSCALGHRLQLCLSLRFLVLRSIKAPSKAVSIRWRQCDSHLGNVRCRCERWRVVRR